MQNHRLASSFRMPVNRYRSDSGDGVGYTATVCEVFCHVYGLAAGAIEEHSPYLKCPGSSHFSNIIKDEGEGIANRYDRECPVNRWGSGVSDI